MFYHRLTVIMNEKVPDKINVKTKYTLLRYFHKYVRHITQNKLSNEVTRRSFRRAYECVIERGEEVCMCVCVCVGGGGGGVEDEVR